MKNLSFLNEFKALYYRYVGNLSTEQKQKIAQYIYISFTLFTVCFFGIFAITPTLNTVSNLDRQYKDNKLVRDKLNEKLSNLQRLESQYKLIQPDLEMIHNAIPKTPKIPYLTRQIENIVKDSNVLMTKLNFGTVEIYPNTKKDSIYSFTFTVIASGDQRSVNNFIANIINFDRIIGIDRLSTGVTEDNKYNVTVTGRAFFYQN